MSANDGFQLAQSRIISFYLLAIAALLKGER